MAECLKTNVIGVFPSYAKWRDFLRLPENRERSKITNTAASHLDYLTPAGVSNRLSFLPGQTPDDNRKPFMMAQDYMHQNGISTYLIIGENMLLHSLHFRPSAGSAAFFRSFGVATTAHKGAEGWRREHKIKAVMTPEYLKQLAGETDVLPPEAGRELWITGSSAFIENTKNPREPAKLSAETVNRIFHGTGVDFTINTSEGFSRGVVEDHTFRINHADPSLLTPCGVWAALTGANPLHSFAVPVAICKKGGKRVV